MPAPSQTLLHPHEPSDLYEPFRELLNDDQFSALIARAHDNQRAIEDIVNNPLRPVIWHHPTPSSGDESDRFYIPELTYLVKVWVSATTAGGSSSTIDVRLNGSAASPAITATLATSAHIASLSPRQVVDPEAEDYVTVKATTVGTSMAGLVVTLFFQPIA